MLLLRFVLMLSIITSQLCYAEQPESDDIDFEIRSIFSDCTSLEIRNIEKTDGLKIDDLNHQVWFDISIISTPLDENIDLWDRFLPDSHQIEHEYRSYKDKLEKLVSAISKAEKRWSLQFENEDHVKQKSEIDTREKEYNDFKVKNKKIVMDYEKLDSRKRHIKDKLARPFLAQCDYGKSWLGLSFLNNIFGNPENHTKAIVVSLEAKSVMARFDTGWKFSSNFQNTRVSLKDVVNFEKDDSDFEEFIKLASQPALFLEECIRIDKTIAIEQGGLTEIEANESANSGCKEQLNDILDCMNNSDLKSCYESHYQVEGQ